jgi:hypothetical protein
LKLDHSTEKPKWFDQPVEPIETCLLAVFTNGRQRAGSRLMGYAVP